MQAIFGEHMKTGEARTGLADAIVLASSAPVCLLCFEREAHDCHRSIVASAIAEQTKQLIHHL